MKHLGFGFVPGIFFFAAFAFGQQLEIKEIALPQAGFIEITALSTAPDGRLFVAARTDTYSPNAGVLFAQETADPNAPLILVGANLPAMGFAELLMIAGSTARVAGFYPVSGNVVTLGQIDNTLSDIEPYKDLETLVTVNPPGVRQVCNDYLIDGGKTPEPPVISGPRPAGDGNEYYLGTDQTSSRILLRGKTNSDATCNLSTVATSATPLLQAWLLPDGSYLTEPIIEIDPINWVSSEIAVMRGNALTRLVSTNKAANPQILATLCCDLAMDWANGAGLATYRTSSGGHAFVYQGGKMQSIYDNEDGSASQFIRAYGLSGTWAVMGVGAANQYVQQNVLLVNRVTRQRWIINASYTAFLPAVTSQGIVYFVGTSGKLFEAAFPATVSITADPPTVTAGGGSTLRITATNYSALWVDNGVGYVSDLTHPPVVTPTATTTYTVIVYGLDGFSVSASATVTVTPAVPLPTIAGGGVVNAASYQPSLAPLALASIFGSNLSQSPLGAAVLPLTATLGGTQVLFNGFPAPLVYVSPTQVNWQIPSNAPVGTATVQVIQNGIAGNTVAIAVSATAPGVFSYDGLGIVTDQNYQIAGTPSNPLLLGMYYTLWATGLGSTDCDAQSGYPATGACSVRVEPTLTIGGQAAQVGFAGLAPGFPGLYQINFVIPGIPDPVQATPSLQVQGVVIDGTAQATFMINVMPAQQ